MAYSGNTESPAALAAHAEVYEAVDITVHAHVPPDVVGLVADSLVSEITDCHVALAAIIAKCPFEAARARVAQYLAQRLADHVEQMAREELREDAAKRDREHYDRIA